MEVPGCDGWITVTDTFLHRVFSGGSLDKPIHSCRHSFIHAGIHSFTHLVFSEQYLRGLTVLGLWNLQMSQQ